jgi:hypothetical protein
MELNRIKPRKGVRIKKDKTEKADLSTSFVDLF